MGIQSCVRQRHDGAITRHWSVIGTLQRGFVTRCAT